MQGSESRISLCCSSPRTAEALYNTISKLPNSLGDGVLTFFGLSTRFFCFSGRDYAGTAGVAFMDDVVESGDSAFFELKESSRLER
jgi:hypothetical protein